MSCSQVVGNKNQLPVFLSILKPEHRWPNNSPKSRQSPFRWGRVSVAPSVISWSRPVVQPNKRCDYHWHASRLTFVQSWQVGVLWGLKLCFVFRSLGEWLVGRLVLLFGVPRVFWQQSYSPKRFCTKNMEAMLTTPMVSPGSWHGNLWMHKNHPEAWKRSLQKMAFRIPFESWVGRPQKTYGPRSRGETTEVFPAPIIICFTLDLPRFVDMFFLFFRKRMGIAWDWWRFLGKDLFFLFGITKSCEDCCTNTAHLISMHRRTRWPFQPAIGNDERCWIHWIHWASVANLQSTGTCVDVCISADIILYIDIAYIHRLFRNKKKV